ncbi:unnamed protein product [Sphagnum balticum]
MPSRNPEAAELNLDCFPRPTPRLLAPRTCCRECSYLQGFLHQERVVENALTFNEARLIGSDYVGEKALEFSNEHFGQDFVCVAQERDWPPVAEFGAVPGLRDESDRAFIDVGRGFPRVQHRRKGFEECGRDIFRALLEELRRDTIVTRHLAFGQCADSVVGFFEGEALGHERVRFLRDHYRYASPALVFQH